MLAIQFPPEERGHWEFEFCCTSQSNGERGDGRGPQVMYLSRAQRQGIRSPALAALGVANLERLTVRFDSLSQKDTLGRSGGECCSLVQSSSEELSGEMHRMDSSSIDNL